MRFYIVDASTLNLKRKYVGCESHVTTSLGKQMTSVNVWNLHPGVCQPIL